MTKARDIADSELGSLTVDTDTLVVDETNNRVGIGTSSPSEALEVNGTSNATNLTRGGSQVYSRDNILGTVSESSGVPTGAIIERGSNSNGEFVKYADGTMICYIREPASRYIGETFTSNGTIQGIDFSRSSNPVSIFPATFSNTDDLTVNVEVYQTGTGSDNPIPIWVVTDGTDISNNEITTQLRGLGGSKSFDGVTDYDGSRLFGTGITIIGRWY